MGRVSAPSDIKIRKIEVRGQRERAEEGAMGSAGTAQNINVSDRRTKLVDGSYSRRAATFQKSNASLGQMSRQGAPQDVKRRV